MGGETGAINTVIEVLVEKIVELFMLGFESLREKIDLFVFRKLIEGAVEHRANVVFAIVDDLFCFLVPKHRDRDSFLKIWIGRSVGFAQIMKTIDWISRFEFIEVFQRRTRSRSFRIAKGPTFLVAERIDNRHADRIFESLQFSEDDCATGPGTCERNIKMITASHRGIRCRSII